MISTEVSSLAAHNNTDAADVGFGGTLDIAGNPGDPGQLQDQGVWEWKDTAECISVRKLKAIVWCSWEHWKNA
jgi:hypothetical protein